MKKIYNIKVIPYIPTGIPSQKEYCSVISSSNLYTVTVSFARSTIQYSLTSAVRYLKSFVKQSICTLHSETISIIQSGALIQPLSVILLQITEISGSIQFLSFALKDTANGTGKTSHSPLFRYDFRFPYQKMHQPLVLFIWQSHIINFSINQFCPVAFGKAVDIINSIGFFLYEN